MAPNSSDGLGVKNSGLGYVMVPAVALAVEAVFKIVFFKSIKLQVPENLILGTYLFRHY